MAGINDCIDPCSLEENGSGLLRVRLAPGGGITCEEDGLSATTAFIPHFEKADGDYVFRSDLRRSVIFGRHDLAHVNPNDIGATVMGSGEDQGKAPATEIATRAPEAVSSAGLAVVSLDHGLVRIVPGPWYQNGVVVAPSSVPLRLVSLRLPA